LPIVEKEYKKRFDASELQCWTEEARKTLKPKMVHEILPQAKSRRLCNIPCMNSWRGKEPRWSEVEIERMPTTRRA